MVTPAWTVDPATARAVADAFAAAPSGPSTSAVRTAYEQLGREAGTWFHRLTAPGRVAAVRVAYTACEEPYADAGELSDAVRRERVMELHSVGLGGERRHPVLDSSVGGAFDQLRAVHDLVSHAHRGFGFDRDGEYAAWRSEELLYGPLARWALMTELHAQHSVRWTTGQLAELKAVLLPPSLVSAAHRRGRPTTTRRRST